jgi:hypothetical protein
MSAWNEKVGILSHTNGFVEVGFHCSRCGAYWQMDLPQDDYSEEAMAKEKCYACSLRDRLAGEIRGKRAQFKKALQIIEAMETERNILLEERVNHDNLLQYGSQIINQQDAVIRDLKKRLEKKSKKKVE